MAHELLRGGREVALLGCECSETGCWPLEADVHLEGAVVTWQRFGQPHRPDRDYSGFGPFVSDAAAYRAAAGALDR